MPVSKILIGSAAVLVLASCGGSSAGSNRTAQPSNPAPSTGTGALTKSAFLTQMNKVCTGVNTEIGKLPQPAAPTDYATVIANLTGTVRQFQPYLAQVDTLVLQSPDAAELQAKWVGPEKTELANFSAAAAKVIADAQAKDATKIQSDITGLTEANSNSATIGSYLTGYGLTECAKLEES